MEKISGIIPANARHTSVDLKSSGNVRSGMPTFGREVGPSHLRNNANDREISAVAMEKHKELMGMRDTTKNPQVEMIQNLSDRFFMKNNKIESPIASVNYGTDADLALSPEQLHVDLLASKKSLDDENSFVQSQMMYVPINIEADDSTQNQSKEPSDEAPYMGRNLDVTV